MNNRKKERKIKQKKLSIGIALGLLLILVLGVFFIGNALTQGSNSYFARIRVAIKKKVQIVYNYNMFVANKITHDVIKKYDNKNQIIQINGSMDNKTISLGKICNLKLAKDDKYRITINYISGSYSSKKDSKPKFVFDFQKDEKYYDDRQNGIHYISGTLPTKDITYDKVAIVKDETVESNCFSFRMYQNENDSTTFKNYKIQILITKLNSKIGVAGEKYGELPTLDKEGYDFDGWYDELKDGKKITETNTILKKYNHTLYAHWLGKKYKINFDLNGGTGDVSKKVTITYGELLPKLKMSTPVKEGNEFLGWYDSNDTLYYESNGTSKIRYYSIGDLALHAKWKELEIQPIEPEKETYTIKYNCGSKSTGNPPKNQTVKTGDKVQIVNGPGKCTKDGYEFDDWEDSTGEKWNNRLINSWNYKNGDYGIINNTLELTATWKKIEIQPVEPEKKTYTISFYSNNGKGGQETAIEVKAGSKFPDISKSKPTREGYVFKGYYDNKNYTEGTQYYASNMKAVTKNKVTANIKLYAGWEIKEFTISFDTNGGKGGQVKDIKAKYDSNMPSITSQKPTREGYIFQGYYNKKNYKNGVQYYDANMKPAVSSTVKSDLMLYAGWEKEIEKYTIKYYCNFTNSSNKAVYTQTVEYGKKITIKDNTCSNNTSDYPARWRDPAGGVWEANKEYTWKYKKGEWGINENNVLILTSVPNYRILTSYNSSTLKYWIEKYGSETSRVANSNYIVTHIWVKDAYNQMKMAINKKKSSNQELEYPRELNVPRKMMEKEIANTSLGLESKGLVAINASPMIDENRYWCPKCPKEWVGTPITVLKIHDGRIIRDSIDGNIAFSNYIYMLGKDGYLTYYKFSAGSSTNESKKNKIINEVQPKYTFGFKPVLIWKGEKQNLDSCKKNHSDICVGTNIRQSICQIDKNDFILITTLSNDSVDRRGGLEIEALQDLMFKYNCQAAFNLDGGGSTGYFYKKNNSTLNEVPGTYYRVRSNVEMLYFAEK